MNEDTLPSETHLGRVGLTAADLEGLIDFYTGVVGLDVVERSTESAVLGAAAGEPLLAMQASEAPERAADAAGLFHLAIRVPDRAALGAVLRRIEDRWTLEGASDHGVSEALYLQDAAGNGVEVYRDRPREDWPRTADGGVSMYTERLDLAALREDAREAATLEAATLGHVHLEVTDLEAAAAFYADALGFTRKDSWARRGAPEALFLAAGGYHHHVGLNTWGGRTAPATGLGLSFFEVCVPDAAAVQATAERLRAAGVDVSDREQGIAAVDPDGMAVRVIAAGE